MKLRFTNETEGDKLLSSAPLRKFLWTDAKGRVDDMMAGLHEIREQMTEEQYELQQLEKRQREKEKLSHQDFVDCSKKQKR